VPTDIFGGRNYQFGIERQGGSINTMATVGVNLPGVFEFFLDGEQYGVFIHQDGRVVTPAAPALPGEILTVFYTGGGKTDPPTATGELASGIHHTERTAIVKINGQTVPMLFSGLTPGFFGLYQANFEMNGARGAAEFTIEHAGAVSKVVNLLAQP
jgi:uncharacterized protein (TIGR03437 family)